MSTYLATLQAELDAVNTAIAACLSNTTTFDWQVGHVRINNTTKLKELREQRKQLISDIQKLCPSEVVESVVDGLNKFGEELVDEDAG